MLWQVKWYPLGDLITFANSARSGQSWDSGVRILPGRMPVQLPNSFEVPGEWPKPALCLRLL